MNRKIYSCLLLQLKMIFDANRNFNRKFSGKQIVNSPSQDLLKDAKKN